MSLRRNKISHIDFVKAQNAYNQMQVLWLTSLSLEQLAQLKFDTGVLWLSECLATETHATGEMISKLISQPMIWKWWCNVWYRKDEEFLPYLYIKYETDKKGCPEYYNDLHKCSVISHPPYNILYGEYDKLVDELLTAKGENV